MEVAVISDSPIPGCETDIPDPFREQISAADYTIHAGDFETPVVLDEIRHLATERESSASAATHAGLSTTRTRESVYSILDQSRAQIQWRRRRC